MANLPPVSWLQAFEAAARTLSFTRAAEELCVSQSAISQRIRLLETRLGQHLFIRHARSLTLTEVGRAWLPSIEDAFSRLAEGTAEVFGVEPEAPVTIRTTPGLQHYWLAPHLANLCQLHPELNLHVVTGVWKDDFISDDVDMEIRYGYGDWPDVVAKSLGAENMVPVCAPALAEQLHEPRDLAGHTLLHATGFSVGWPTWFAAVGLESLEDSMNSLWCDTHIMTLRLAARGIGVALIYERFLADVEGLTVPFETRCTTSEEFWLTCTAQRSLRGPARTVWDYLENDAANA
ncbi:LysR family transcriptional regulator [Salinisphaera sp. USBA-960]|uniref:LysR substrate-binding domain-containing protein n=1 Tax=Salinisphaera orenii TaxID=856731 RepID=UPI000DBE1F30|nr:LysR family transcriptional regulator [Salifodinibacter halophilus]NNC26093.1 LysR family transcriptional regulator [Salifodinibacter halophilus]